MAAVLRCGTALGYGLRGTAVPGGAGWRVPEGAFEPAQFAPPTAPAGAQEEAEAHVPSVGGHVPAEEGHVPAEKGHVPAVEQLAT
eukprot:3788434-Rhodomonas_salina.1